ncbi:MAG TPA: hypothetical protein VNC61_17585 [Acidimicrobiales bacterium]|nr:hypothetical protein [Acidimicrobiales bacterium]
MPSTEERPDESCASCGGPGDDLAEVRRIYLTVDAGGRVTGSETTEGAELWCRSCRTLYPHEPSPHGAGGWS